MTSKVIHKDMDDTLSGRSSMVASMIGSNSMKIKMNQEEKVHKMGNIKKRSSSINESVLLAKKQDMKYDEQEDFSELKPRKRAMTKDRPIKNSYIAHKSRFKKMKEDGQEDHFVNMLKHRMYNFLMKTQAGFLLDLFNTFLSLVACVLYVYETYLEQDNILPTGIIITEVTLAVIFTVDYLLHLFIAESRFQYIFSNEAIIDFAAILPVITLVSDAPIAFLRVLRVFRVMRILRIYRILASSDEDEGSGVQRQVYILVFTIVSFAFVAAGVIHSVEQLVPGSFQKNNLEIECKFDSAFYTSNPQYLWPKDCQLDFWTCFYFIFTTVSTIGFGDIYPTNALAQATLVFTVALLFIIVPPEFSKLNELMANTSRYDRAYLGCPTGHVIVCGNVNFYTALSFLNEFYHEDHGEQRRQVVLLGKTDPSNKLKQVLLDPFYEDKVHYVRGRWSNERDLLRCRFGTSHAAFLLAEVTAVDPVKADMEILLGIKCMRDLESDVPIFSQLLLTDSRVHYSWAPWTHLLCMNETKMGLLAKSILFPGYSTLVANLVCSSSDWEGEEEEEEEEDQMDVEKKKKRKSMRGIQGLVDSANSKLNIRGDGDWMTEYLHGFGQEIYCFELPTCFVGQQFNKVSDILYQDLGVCLFAVDTETPSERKRQDRIRALLRKKTTNFAQKRQFLKEMNEKTSKNKRVMLMNPQNYSIQQRDKGLIIADDHEQTIQIQEYVEKDLYKNRFRCEFLIEEDQVPGKLTHEGKSEPFLNGTSDWMSSSITEVHNVNSSAVSDVTISETKANLFDGYIEKTDSLNGSLHLHSQDIGRVLGHTPPNKKSGNDEHVLPRKLQNHTIICGNFTSLSQLLKPLREDSKSTIVILHHIPIEDDLKAHLHSIIDDLYFVAGTPLSRHDLDDVGIRNASNILIRTFAESKDTTVMGNPDDAAIFTACYVEANYNCRVVVELENEKSMKYLKFKAAYGTPYSLWPQFCSGQVYFGSTLDTLMTSAFYNPKLLDAIRILTLGSKSREDSKHLRKMQMRLGNPIKENSKLMQMKIPKIYVSKPCTYQSIFQELLITRNILPIGVLRSPLYHSSPLTYVVTNPKQDLYLSGHDRLFVLC